jgi:hypothetical protein
MKTVQNNLDSYIQQERMYHFEGESGVKRLETIVGVLGYTSFMGQSKLLTFLSDNPGAQEALVNWIGEQRVSEWNDNLAGQLDDEDGQEDDEDEEEDV